MAYAHAADQAAHCPLVQDISDHAVAFSLVEAAAFADHRVKERFA